MYNNRMKNKTNKKIILGFGSIAAVAIPVTATIKCKKEQTKYNTEYTNTKKGV